MEMNNAGYRVLCIEVRENRTEQLLNHDSTHPFAWKGHLSVNYREFAHH